MVGVHISNINLEKLAKSPNGINFKLKKIMISGLVVMSLVPGLAGCKKNEDENITSTEQVTETVYFDEEERAGENIFFDEGMSNAAIEELKEFGEHVTTINLSNCQFIDDLSMIPEYCPNLEGICIDTCPSINDLSFIYSLPNLKEVVIFENGFITPELIDYLDSKSITHNLTKQDLENSAELDRIISEIITDDMTDEEKIQAITYYVIDNLHYDLKNQNESNNLPLSSTLKNKGGVCVSYAYLTNLLLRKADITSYKIRVEGDHTWNLVELDGKYYYIDTTNIDRIPFISKLALKYFNVGVYYMTDPKATSFSAMTDYDNANKISIPEEMIEDIEKGESIKNIYEKYGNSYPARIIELVLAITSVTIGLKLAANGIDAIKDTVSYRKSEKERERREKERRQRQSSRKNEYYGRSY